MAGPLEVVLRVGRVVVAVEHALTWRLHLNHHLMQHHRYHQQKRRQEAKTAHHLHCVKREAEAQVGWLKVPWLMPRWPRVLQQWQSGCEEVEVEVARTALHLVLPRQRWGTQAPHRVHSM